MSWSYKNLSSVILDFASDSERSEEQQECCSSSLSVNHFVFMEGTALLLGELPRNQIENVYELSSFQVGSDLYSDHIFQNFGGKVCVCVCVYVSKWVKIKIVCKVLHFYRCRTAIASHGDTIFTYSLKIVYSSNTPWYGAIVLFFASIAYIKTHTQRT